MSMTLGCSSTTDFDNCTMVKKAFIAIGRVCCVPANYTFSNNTKALGKSCILHSGGSINAISATGATQILPGELVNPLRLHSAMLTIARLSASSVNLIVN